MKRIILFRFHKSPAVCKNRIQLLRLFNPGTEIYGLYGGEEREFNRFRTELSQGLGHIYCVSGKSPEWKWKNGDLAIKSWYIDYGRNLPFDMLHVIEWDLLLFNSISHIYGHIPENGIGLSGLILLKDVQDKLSWTSKEPLKSEWKEFLSYIKEKYKYNMEPYASIAGGACFPKMFLERYSAIDIPELCNDELRVSLFSQILGFKLYDTGLYKWFDESEEDFFNVEIRDIETKTIKSELRKPSGRRVFHPYRKVFCQIVDCNRWYNIYRTSRDVARLFLKQGK